MAAPSMNAGIPADNSQFPAGSGEVLRQQWFPDGHDAFVLWIRGEFVAANAIIDSLVNHLQAIGDPGEYDHLIGSIHHRRFNWVPVLYLQQYFSVAEVQFALQQVVERRQKRHLDAAEPMEKDSRRRNIPTGHRQRHVDTPRGSSNLPASPSSMVTEHGKNWEVKSEKGRDSETQITMAEKKGSDNIPTSQTDCSLKDQDKLHGIQRVKLEVADADNSNHPQLRGSDNIPTSRTDCSLKDQDKLHGIRRVKLEVAVADNSNHPQLRGSDNIPTSRTDCSLKDQDKLHGIERVKLEVAVADNSDHPQLRGSDNIRTSRTDCSLKDQDKLHGIERVKLEVTDADNSNHPQLRGSSKDDLPQGSESMNSKQDEKQKLVPIPKVFVGNDKVEGKTVNAVEGLKLYEELFNSSEIRRLISMANDLLAAGRSGELQGQTAMLLRRPMKGHGRYILQLGLPIIECSPEDETTTGNYRDQKVEAIPSLVQDVFDRLAELQVLSVAPDFCIIDFYNEGDYSHPHFWPASYGRPVFTLFLTECDVFFGRAAALDHQVSLKLSLAAGSLVVMPGKNMDIAKHAIPFSNKQRILVTFGKSQPRKYDGLQRSPSSSSPLSSWGRRPLSVGPVAGWAAAHLRHLAPPGTGVFLPPHGSDQHLNKMGKSNGDGIRPECNGNSSNGDGKEDHQQQQLNCCAKKKVANASK